MTGKSGRIMALQVHLNPAPAAPGIVVLPAGPYRRAKRDIVAWPSDTPTPLHDLPALAAASGIATLRLKHETARFGFAHGAPPGPAYAIADLLLAELARAGIAPAATTADLDIGRYDLSFCTIALGDDLPLLTP